MPTYGPKWMQVNKRTLEFGTLLHDALQQNASCMQELEKGVGGE